MSRDIKFSQANKEVGYSVRLLWLKFNWIKSGYFEDNSKISGDVLDKFLFLLFNYYFFRKLNDLTTLLLWLWFKLWLGLADDILLLL